MTVNIGVAIAGFVLGCGVGAGVMYALIRAAFEAEDDDRSF